MVMLIFIVLVALVRNCRMLSNDSPSVHEDSSIPTVHVAFLVFGSVTNIHNVEHVVRSILNARNKQWSLVYHVVTYREVMMWGSEKSYPSSANATRKIYLLEHLSRKNKNLYNQFKLICGRVAGQNYMIKPLLHYILAKISRVIVLDIDLFVAVDLLHIWLQFDKMDELGVCVGLVEEQQPNYYFKGAVGYNGGVQLLNLAAMRSGYSGYSQAISYIISKRKAEPNFFINIFGMSLGDQDFYSWLRVYNSSLCMSLPCHWNIQLCDHFFKALYNHKKHSLVTLTSLKKVIINASVSFQVGCDTATISILHGNGAKSAGRAMIRDFFLSNLTGSAFIQANSLSIKKLRVNHELSPLEHVEKAITMRINK